MKPEVRPTSYTNPNKMSLDSKFKFGKYANKALIDVMREDLPYLCWLRHKDSKALALSLFTEEANLLIDLAMWQPSNAWIRRKHDCQFDHEKVKEFGKKLEDNSFEAILKSRQEDLKAAEIEEAATMNYAAWGSW